MINILELGGSVKMMVYLLLSLSFFIGILLMISQESFSALHKVLQEEYGIKKKLVPMMEDVYIDVVDKFLVRNRLWAGLFIAIASFTLLLINK